MTVDAAPIPVRARDEQRDLAPIVEMVNRFRTRQGADGTVPEPSADDVALLDGIRAAAVRCHRDHGRPEQADALDRDVLGWIDAGLDTPPDFTRTRDAFVAPADGETAVFLAPVLTTNSAAPVGRRLECFHALRREPRALPDIGRRYPHPKNNCQATILLSGSHGFSTGNCIVFFPENVAAHTKVERQKYAVFFFNKFRRIHETLALPAARSIFEPDTVPTASTGLRPDDCYEARSLWGYLHDYFHHQGRWPFDENIKLKSNWFVGLLEETKVDCLTALAAAEDPTIPFREEQIAMITLERICRYPQAPDATRNFDSGTGVLLYSWLRERGALAGPAGRLRYRDDEVLDGMRAFVRRMTDLEDTVTDDRAYREAALSLVRRYLPEGEPGDRYAFTADQRLLLEGSAIRELGPLGFAEGEL